MINKILKRLGLVLTKMRNVHKLRDLKVVLDKHNISTNCIIDVGANVGQTVINFHEIFYIKDYYAIEPFSEPFEKLTIQCNSKKYSHVQFFKLAFSDKEEQVAVEKHDLRGSSLNSLLPHLSGGGGIENINCTRIDSFVRMNNIGIVDLLKIDVEGFEFQVLIGAGDFLLEVKAVYVEIGFYPQKRNIVFEDMRKFLEERSFVFAGIFDQSNFQIKTKTHFGNALFLNSKMI
jgi:FkbM family methyltransferase